MKKCSRCGTENSKDAIFCENCGNKLSESKKVVCQNCGFPNSVEASFCENCGSKLSGVQSSDTISDNNIDNTYEKQKDDSRIRSKNLRRSQVNSKSNSLRNIVVTVAIIIVIVIGAVSLGYFKSNRQTENSRNSNSTVVQKDKSNSSEKSSSSNSNSYSESSSSSEKEISDNSEKLSVSTLTNKQNAASILVYGALKADVPLFKGNYELSLKNSQLYVSLVKLNDDETEADETPILYELAPGQMDSSCGYKLGRNREVYFYSQVKDTPGFNRISATTQDEIVDYINSHHLVDKVNEIANNTVVNGE
ncbi:zinc ribbon domain-containing protein [Ligilactobacillus salivarius]|nr:zinc ribbon domain-containing protein [Ligilactobacillus salivarius]